MSLWNVLVFWLLPEDDKAEVVKLMGSIGGLASSAFLVYVRGVARGDGDAGMEPSSRKRRSAAMNLNVSTLFFELALIFIPGFVWMKIHSRYGAKVEHTQFDQILNAFIFGVLSYALLYVMCVVIGRDFNLLNLDSDPKKLIPPELFPDVFLATMIAVLGGIAMLYLENYKLFTRFVQKIRATKTYGDEDVWDFIFNSSSPEVDFVHFRDFEHRVVYAGLVEVFSESGQIRELVLRDVAVYDFEGTEMYRVPRLYLAKERENMHIEFPIGT